MSNGSGSSERKINTTVDTLNRCLMDIKIEKARRIQVMNKLLQLEKKEDLDWKEDESDISDTENPPEAVAQEFSQLVNIINKCWEPNGEKLPEPVDYLSQMQPLQRWQKLLCFMLLDEDAVLTEKQLTYWWIGLGLIDLEDDKDADDAALAILSELIEAGHIEQVSPRKKYRRKISRLTDSQLTNQEVGILRKQGGKQTLTCASSGDIIIDSKSKARLHTLFNRDVSNLSLSRDWVRQMKGLMVFHLGSWSADKNTHVEFNNLEFLQALKYLKKLTFISFKGVSSIMSLSDEICDVGGSLRILDLQDCPNLEFLPKRIGNLYNLSHLDLSQCYLLQCVPKSIIFLTKLQVLKGFVIGKADSSCSSSACKFKDLASHLGPTLRKLSIINRNVCFPLEEDMQALAQFEKLLKLKIIWVRMSNTTQEQKLVSEQTSQQKQEMIFKPELKQMNSKLLSFKTSLAKTFQGRDPNATVGLLHQLTKLDVQDIPQNAVNSLLFGDNYRLQNLKKLYIIGGDVSDISNLGKVRYGNVDTIKLKYLTKLHMSWMQLKASFPAVAQLEVVQCPFLTFFPSDTTGIWEQLQNV